MLRVVKSEGVMDGEIGEYMEEEEEETDVGCGGCGCGSMQFCKIATTLTV